MKNWDMIMRRAVGVFNRQAEHVCHVIYGIEAQRNPFSPVWELLCFRRIMTVHGERLFIKKTFFPLVILPLGAEYFYECAADLLAEDSYEMGDVGFFMDIVTTVGKCYPNVDCVVPYIDVMESDLRTLLKSNRVHGDHDALISYIAAGAYRIASMPSGGEAWVHSLALKSDAYHFDNIPEEFLLVQK